MPMRRPARGRAWRAGSSGLRARTMVGVAPREAVLPRSCTALPRLIDHCCYAGSAVSVPKEGEPRRALLCARLAPPWRAPRPRPHTLAVAIVSGLQRPARAPVRQARCESSAAGSRSLCERVAPTAIRHFDGKAPCAPADMGRLQTDSSRKSSRVRSLARAATD